MMTTDLPSRPRGRWRAGVHTLAKTATAILVAAVAAHWAWSALQARAPGLPDLRYVDAVAAVSALTLVVFTLGLAWRAGAAPGERA